MSSPTIQIKRSTRLGKPSFLRPGELAYSSLTGKLYIGSPIPNSEDSSKASTIYEIAGKAYTDQFNLVTDSDTNKSTITIGSGDNVSTILTNPYVKGAGSDGSNVSLSDYINTLIDNGNTYVGGTGITVTKDITSGKFNISISDSGVSAGTFGSTTAIPVITVNSKGQITQASTASLSTALTVNTSKVDLLSGKLNTGAGLSFVVSSDNKSGTLSVDSTVVKTSGDQTVDGVKTFTTAPVIKDGTTTSPVATQADITSLSSKITGTTVSKASSQDTSVNLTITPGTDGTTLSAVLPPSGISDGAYAGITFNDRGIATSASKLTTLSSYGITDKLLHLDSSSVQSVTGPVNFTSSQVPTVSYTNSDGNTTQDIIASQSWVVDKINSNNTAQTLSFASSDSSVTVTKNETAVDVKLPVSGVTDNTSSSAKEYNAVRVNNQGVVVSAKSYGVLRTDLGTSESQTINGRVLLSGVSLSDIADNDLVTKEYVDKISAGQHPQKAVVTAIIEETFSSTYATGSNSSLPGVGATLTLFGVTGASIAGVTVSVGDRVLTNNQTDKKQNGVYVVDEVSGTTVKLVRADNLDGDPDSEVYAGSSYLVTQGKYQGTIWTLSNKTIKFGTDEISFVQTAAPNAYNAGSGITIDSNKISISTGNTTQVVNGKLEIASKSSCNTNVTAGMVLFTDGLGSTIWKSLAEVDINDSATGVLSLSHGGTGNANSSDTDIKIGKIELVSSGSASKVTVPTSGVLATQAGAETLSNKVLSEIVSLSGVSNSDNSVTSTLTGFIIDAGNY